jgi:solute carrier family 25 (mitochondrial 2-oxodicarboxylate transporter), member 21
MEFRGFPRNLCRKTRQHTDRLHGTLMSDSFSLFLAGAFSGIAECIAVQPFDMVKTRHQLNTGSSNLGVYETFKELVREGGIRRLYRGMFAEMAGMIPKTSAMYSTYELSRRYLSQDLQLGETSVVCAVSGFIASFPEALIVTPSQVVKVRLQAKEHLGRYTGPWHCFVDIVRKEGPFGLFIGLGPTIWRNCIWNTVYFGVMNIGKSHMNQLTGNLSNQHSLTNSFLTFISGFIGATFATCFNAPFDVVKSRFQSQVLVPGTLPKYKSTLQTLYLIYTEEGGLKSCYKGFKPKVLRMGLGGAVAMTTFDLFQMILKPKTQ